MKNINQETVKSFPIGNLAKNKLVATVLLYFKKIKIVHTEAFPFDRRIFKQGK